MNSQDVGGIIIILTALPFLYWALKGHYRRYIEIISNRKGN